MDSWYVYTIIALFAFGIQRFLYKVSAARKCNTAWTTFAFMGTVALLGFLSFITVKETVPDVFFLLFISLVNSVSFLAGTMSTLEALKHISTGIAYPIIRLNTGIVVIFSILYFKDSLSPYQIAGIIIAISVILILTRYGNNGTNEKTTGKNGNCPHEEIINLYHEVLPELPGVRTWPENNRKILRTRWKEEPERQNLAWWRSYFEYIRESQFLMGREKDWMANLEWIVRPKNMTKILNGSYHKQRHGGIQAWLNQTENNSQPS